VGMVPVGMEVEVVKLSSLLNWGWSVSVVLLLWGGGMVLAAFKLSSCCGC